MERSEVATQHLVLRSVIRGRGEISPAEDPRDDERLGYLKYKFENEQRREYVVYSYVVPLIILATIIFAAQCAPIPNFEKVVKMRQARALRDKHTPATADEERTRQD